MSELLIAKSGKQEHPVLKKKELEINELKSIVGNRKLTYLGPPAEELPPIDQPSKVDGFKDPDSVVILVSDAEANSLNYKDSGFYLVNDLHPSDLE